MNGSMDVKQIHQVVGEAIVDATAPRTAAGEDVLDLVAIVDHQVIQTVLNKSVIGDLASRAWRS